MKLKGDEHKMTYLNLYLPEAPTTAIKILAGSVGVSGKKSIDISPSANIEGPAIAQTQSFENLTFNIQRVLFTESTDTITMEDVLTLYRHKFNNSDPAYIEAMYGEDKMLYGSDGVTTKIPVVLETFNFPIDMKTTKDGYIPSGSLVFKETNVE